LLAKRTQADCALPRLPLHPTHHQSVFEQGRYRFAQQKRVKTNDQWRVAPQIREPMRAEVERLVEEIKQSVGLLRRHL
jgi:hypothetical protein